MSGWPLTPLGFFHGQHTESISIFVFVLLVISTSFPTIFPTQQGFQVRNREPFTINVLLFFFTLAARFSMSFFEGEPLTTRAADMGTVGAVKDALKSPLKVYFLQLATWLGDAERDFT